MDLNQTDPVQVQTLSRTSYVNMDKLLNFFKAQFLHL